MVSAGIFAQAIIERSEMPVSSPDETPVVPLAPVDGE